MARKPLESPFVLHNRPFTRQLPASGLGLSRSQATIGRYRKDISVPRFATGVVESWDSDRGFGVIMMDGNIPVWAHFSTIRGVTGFVLLNPGEHVAMTLQLRDPVATNAEAPGFAWITSDVYPIERTRKGSYD